MAENQESTPNIIESLALVTDAMQNIFPDGNIICLYELKNDDFKKVQQNFRQIDHHHNRFSVNISGLEHAFVNQDAPDEEPEKTTDEVKEEPKDEEPKTITKKVSSWFKRS